MGLLLLITIFSLISAIVIFLMLANQNTGYIYFLRRLRGNWHPYLVPSLR